MPGGPPRHLGRFLRPSAQTRLLPSDSCIPSWDAPAYQNLPSCSTFAIWTMAENGPAPIWTPLDQHSSRTHQASIFHSSVTSPRRHPVLQGAPNDLRRLAVVVYAFSPPTSPSALRVGWPSEASSSRSCLLLQPLFDRGISLPWFWRRRVHQHLLLIPRHDDQVIGLRRPFVCREQEFLEGKVRFDILVH